jgi:hypothetical protein
MAFHGDFSSLPLPEILQWMDSSRKRGPLLLKWQGTERKLFVVDGRVLATSSRGLWERLARLLSLAHQARAEDVLAAFAQMRRTDDPAAAFSERGLKLMSPVALAADELYGTVADLTSAQEGEFHWTEDSDRSEEEWVPVDLGLRQLLFEALRWVDEQPDVERALPSDALIVRAKVPLDDSLSLSSQVILALTEKGLGLGKLRLALGVSRAYALRRVFDLLRQQRVEVDGAGDVEVDPIAQLLEKGSVLVRERQFDAAALIISALLTTDPSERRVREFARMVEQEHVGALYGELPPLWVPGVHPDPDTQALLKHEERQVVSLVNGSWDISTIVLASHLRELDTLKTLSKLRRLGLLGPA